jgi:DNA-binding NtrC family response regulator
MSDPLRSVVLIDGEQSGRERLAAMIRKEVGCVVFEAGTPAEGLEILAREDICVMVSGIFPGEKTGLQLHKEAFRINSQVVTIPCVPLGDRESAVEALNTGAFFYLNYPIDEREGVIAVARALYYYDLLIHREKRGAKVRKSDGFHGIIGTSGKMRSLFSLIERVAEDGISTVLIQGESGTGKELVARAIHAFSIRKGKNFVPVNCAAIPDELLESELFGHVKGSFTGATQNKMGRIQFADRGTLFLDEIGDMKPNLQAKLLRVLQEKEFDPVGQVQAIKVDARVIAATHRNLDQLVQEGSFREDLFYRLSVVPITIPPLRERKEDIPLLIEKFVQIYNRNRQLRLQGFEPAAMAALIDYPWPGNVRQLENLVQQMVVLHGGMTVRLVDLPEKLVSRSGEINSSAASAPVAGPEFVLGPAGVDFNSLVNDFETRLILQALEVTNGNKKEAARILNLKRTTLLEKLKKKGLQAH